MGSRLLVRRRFLHGPGQCRAGCGACLGSVIAGLRRAGRPRRAVVAAVGALAVAAGMVVLPFGRDLMPWREQAAVLASELALVGPEPGTPAASLAQDLTLLGYTPPPDDPAVDPPPAASRDEQSDESDEQSEVDDEGDSLDDQTDDTTWFATPAPPRSTTAPGRSAETSAVDPDDDMPEETTSPISTETGPSPTRSAAAAPTTVDGSDPAAMPPITVAGDQILRDGEPWWFLGYNSFVWSGDCGHDDEQMSAADVEQWFSEMRHDGHGAVRLFFYDGWDIERLDAAVESAKRHNVYLTITLDDAIGGCGENDKDASWFADQSEREVYQAHMEMLLERYRGESAVAWFEYFNEPSYEGGALREFYDEMGAAADRIDPDRLFSSGTVAPYWLDGEDNFLDVHESPGVDIASMHEYDEGEVESNHGDGVRANSAGKPVIVGEYGITAGEGCESDFGSRAERVADKAEAYTSIDGYVGAFAWAWQPGGGGCELGNLDADTATQEVLRDYAAGPADLDAPDVTAPADRESDRDSGGQGWERTAQSLAEALASADDPAARELLEVLVQAGFGPADTVEDDSEDSEEEQVQPADDEIADEGEGDLAAPELAPVSESLAEWLASAGAEDAIEVMVHGIDLAAAEEAVAATGMRRLAAFDRIGVVLASAIPGQVEAARTEPGVTYLEGERQLQLYSGGEGGSGDEGGSGVDGMSTSTPGSEPAEEGRSR